eukprot:1157685-Pyramimonas_sp.AAC.1
MFVSPLRSDAPHPSGTWAEQIRMGAGAGAGSKANNASGKAAAGAGLHTTATPVSGDDNMDNS